MLLSEIATFHTKHEARAAHLQQVKEILKPIAEKYHANEFDQFEAEALSIIPRNELGGVDLWLVFNQLNPERIRQQQELDTKLASNSAAAWANYGSERAAGNLQGTGPTGNKNWTGD